MRIIAEDKPTLDFAQADVVKQLQFKTPDQVRVLLVIIILYTQIIIIIV